MDISYENAKQFINSIRKQGYSFEYTVMCDKGCRDSKWCGILSFSNKTFTFIDLPSLSKLVMSVISKMYNEKLLHI